MCSNTTFTLYQIVFESRPKLLNQSQMSPLTGVHCGGSGIPVQFLLTAQVCRARSNIFPRWLWQTTPFTNSYCIELELKYYCSTILTLLFGILWLVWEIHKVLNLICFYELVCLRRRQNKKTRWLHKMTASAVMFWVTVNICLHDGQNINYNTTLCYNGVDYICYKA